MRDHLLDLQGIPLRLTQTRLHLLADVDTLVAHLFGVQLERAPHRLLEREAAATFAAFLLGELAQVADDLADPAGLLQRLLQRVGLRRRVAELLAGERDEAGDRRERIVQLVGDACAQGADRRQAARAQDLVLRELQLGGAVFDALLQIRVPGADLVVAAPDLADHVIESVGELPQLVARIHRDGLVVAPFGERADSLRELAHRSGETTREQHAQDAGEDQCDRRPENRVSADAHRAAEGSARGLRDRDRPPHGADRRCGREPFRAVRAAHQTRERSPRADGAGDELFFVGRELGRASEDGAVLRGKETGPGELPQPPGDFIERQLGREHAPTAELQRDRNARRSRRATVGDAQRGAGPLRERDRRPLQQRLQIRLRKGIRLLRVLLVHRGREKVAIPVEQSDGVDERELPVRNAQHRGQLGVGELIERQRAHRETQTLDAAGHRALDVARRLRGHRSLRTADRAFHLRTVQGEGKPAQQCDGKDSRQGKEREEAGAEGHEMALRRRPAKAADPPALRL